MRKLKFFSLIFLFLLSISVFAVSVIQTNDADGSLTIVYPKHLYYPQSTNTTIPFDVLDSNYTKLTNATASCQYDIIGILGNEIISSSLSYDTAKEYWIAELNKTHTKDTGKYNFYVHCSNTADNRTEAGFVSLVFDITEGGIIEAEKTDISIESNVNLAAIMMFGVIIFAFLFLIVGSAIENQVFAIVSAVLFVIDGLIFITTGISGIDSKFTIGIGTLLVIVGAFIALVTFKVN